MSIVKRGTRRPVVQNIALQPAGERTRLVLDAGGRGRTARQQDNALVTVQDQAVTISLDPPPAERFAPGYTRAAWAWLLLNKALDRANIPMPDEDRKEIAILISKRTQISAPV